VDALLDHPKIRGRQFCGLDSHREYVYARAAPPESERSARARQNHVIVLPDADMKMATQIISDSAFGCAGQRCLAVSSPSRSVRAKEFSRLDYRSGRFVAGK